MHVCFEPVPQHADGIANVVLRVERKFLRQDVQHFAIVGQSNAPRRFNGAAHILPLHVACARANSYGHAAAAVDPAHVPPGNTSDPPIPPEHPPPSPLLPPRAGSS